MALILDRVALEPTKDGWSVEVGRLKGRQELGDTHPDCIIPSDISKSEDGIVAFSFLKS